MRPIQFPRAAPSAGLTIASGAVGGVNQALQNIAKMRMQRAQIAYHQEAARGMATWRQAQAESLRQKTMGSSLADVQLLQALAKGGAIPESTMKTALKPRIEQFLDTAKPEEKAALAQHINQQMSAGKIPEEIAPNLNFNVNQMKMLGQGAANQTKENVATTQAGAKVGAAQITGDSRENTAQIRADASMGKGAERSDLRAMQDITSRMKQIEANRASLDKPTALGAIPLDDSVKESVRKKYESDLVDLHSQYNEIHNRMRGVESPPAPPSGAPSTPNPGQPFQNGSGPSAMASPKTYSWDQRQQAKAGDIVTNQVGIPFTKTESGFLPIPTGGAGASGSGPQPTTPALPASAPLPSPGGMGE